MAGKRRADGEGSLWKHKGRNRWMAEVGGKRLSFKTQGQARDAIAALKLAEAKGTVNADPGSLGEWLGEWLSQLKSDIEESTRYGYRSLIACHIAPHLVATAKGRLVRLGDLPLNEVRTSHLQGLITEKNKELSPSRVRELASVLRQALALAADKDYRRIVDSPATNLKSKSIPLRQSTVDVLLNQLEGRMEPLVSALKAHPRGVVFLTQLWSGMRRGEVLGLRWSDIDFKRWQISVVQNLRYTAGHEVYVKPPKNGKSRIVPLTQRLADQLKLHRARQQDWQREAGPLWQGDTAKFGDLVFTRPTGAFLWPDSLTRDWELLRVPCGLAAVRQHDLRHAYASVLIKSGADIKEVQKIMGHASAKLTLDLYGHLFGSSTRETGRRIDAFLDQLDAQATNQPRHDGDQEWMN